jgi:hypothetical protein
VAVCKLPTASQRRAADALIGRFAIAGVTLQLHGTFGKRVQDHDLEEA